MIDLKEAEQKIKDNPDRVIEIVKEYYFPRSYCNEIGSYKGKWGYEPFPGQKEVHFDKSRIRVLDAGRRWGKTQLSAKEVEAYIVASSPNYLNMPLNILIAAPEKQQTEKIFNAMFENIKQAINTKLIDLTIPKSGYTNAKKEYKFLRFNNGTLVKCGSAANEQTLVGDPIDLLVGDEWAYIDFRIWNRMMATLSTKGRMNKGLLISTPNALNFFYDLFVAGQKGYKPYRSWQFPSWLSPYCTEEIIEEAKRTMDPMMFRQEFGAEFIAFFGKVFEEFTRTENTDEFDYERNLPLYHSVDFGRNFPVLEVFQVLDLNSNNPQVRQLDEWNPRGSATIYDLHDEIIKMQNKYRIPDEIFGDVAGSYKHTRGDATTGYSDIEYLKSKGINVRYCTHPVLRRIPEGIKLINAFIKNANGDVRFKIHSKNCPRAIEDMERIKYPINKDGMRKDNRPFDDNYHIHSIDNKRYFFINLFGKEIIPPERKSKLIYF